MRTVLRLALAAALAAAGPWPGVAQEQDPERVLAVCRDCHEDTDPGRVDALEHADSLTCRTCHHVGLTNDPAQSRANRVDACAACHVDVEPSHHASVPDGPECTTCHLIHDAPSLEEGGSELVAERCGDCHVEPHALHAPAAATPATCADCHVEHAPTGAGEGSGAGTCAGCHAETHPEHRGVEEFGDCAECHDVTGLEAPRAGEPEAASSCVQCHMDVPTAHAAADDAPSCTTCHDPGGPDEPDASCAECHDEEHLALVEGGHGGSGVAVGVLPPTCASCHVVHDDGAGARDPRRRAVLETVRCIECHEDEAVVGPYALTRGVSASYEGDFHGATVRFLAEDGATPSGEDVLLCSDCHGAHDVHLLERSEIAEVCASCHEDGGAALAGAWLGHAPVGPGNGTLVWLVRLFYVFLIPFMLGGLFLTIVFHLIDQRRKGARIRESEGLRRLVDRMRGRAAALETVKRFSNLERFEHAGAMITFILLVVTGLPQTRPDVGAARWVIGLFGGIWSTRLIHRIVGFTFVALVVIHVTRAIRTAIRERRMPAMVPTRKDFEDVLQTFRHYLFRRPLPKVGKFDFSQKFEYWGLFLGGIVMSATGIVLVFPELVTQVLPGVVVAALRVTHGLEATFAVLVIVLWHSYGVILRPEIFPLDTSIFTGRMDVKRLKHEHALEYERLFGEEAGD